MPLRLGKMETSGSISIPIDEKIATTDYAVLESVKSRSIWFFKLGEIITKKQEEGINLENTSLALGNPILGDKEYGKEGLILHGKGLYLHAGVFRIYPPFYKAADAD